jgi:signal transduction histidine kinase
MADDPLADGEPTSGPRAGAGGDAAGAELDAVRVLIPVFAVVIGVLAVVAEPADWWQPILLAVAAGMFAAWARWDFPIPILTVGVLAVVIVVQLDPHLEPATFLACLLGIVVTRWAPIGLMTGACVLAMLATPVVIETQRGDGYGWPIWIIAIIFTTAIGWTLRRQQLLSTQLHEARLELAQATLLEERRRIARDVHDLVGHGLAAIMVQVTSARHVLTRDPTAADEALGTAEDVGRQSMRELRRTVALLRNENESGLDEPLPKLTQLGDLVDAARERGLNVEFHAEGAHEAVDPVIGLTLHRIAQEALANASRHAPNARTVVTTSVTADAVVLEVDSLGAVADRPDGMPHFGLQGMRERADVVGGEFSAGPSERGWTVRCRVPRRAPE